MLFIHFFIYLCILIYAHRQACEAGLQNYEIRDPAIIQSASDQIRPIKYCRWRIRQRRDSNTWPRGSKIHVINRPAIPITKIAVFHNSNMGGTCATLPHHDIVWCHAWPSMTPKTATTLQAMCMRDTHRPLCYEWFPCLDLSGCKRYRMEAS